MNATFQPRCHTLSAAQRLLWPQLAGTRSLGYVLYGGTAIALRLGHRVSVDFDFFTEQPLDQPGLRRALPMLADADTLQASANTWTVLTKPPQANGAGIKISFFGSIDCGRVGAPDNTADGMLQVASLADLMATKLKVILQRVEAKDYRDIAAMIRAGAELARGLAAARVMFGNTFQPSESLKALTWFQGGDLDTLTADDQDILIEASSAVRGLPVIPLVSTTLGA